MTDLNTFNEMISIEFGSSAELVEAEAIRAINNVLHADQPLWIRARRDYRSERNRQLNADRLRVAMARRSN